MWINLLNVKIPYNEKQLEYRHINMFVWYQIRQMIDDNIELGKILIIDKDGFLRVNNDTDLLTDEQKDNIRRLLDNERQGIYILNRFKDLESKLKTNKEYNKWFDEVAMNTFMQTIPTKAVFYTFPRDLLYEIKGTHSRYELNREDFSGYSIWQTMYALDIIDPFLVALILGGKIENIEKHNYETY